MNYPKTLRVQLSAHHNQQAEMLLEALRNEGWDLPPRDPEKVYEVDFPARGVERITEQDERPDGWDLSTDTQGPLIHYFMDVEALTEEQETSWQELFQGIGERCSRMMYPAEKWGDLIDTDRTDESAWYFHVFVDVSELSA